MKKTFLLTILLTLCGMATAWAEFAPEVGKRYALKEKTSGLYLDIQTLGINEANAGGTTNNISLNTNPCVIYFEEGAEGKWKMKNVDGTYVQQATSRDWNVVIGTTPYEWTFKEQANGTVAIARADGKYINVDSKVAGQPLFCDKASGMEFTLMGHPSVDCSTEATSQNGKMYFSSEKIAYEGACNKLRFTLTESGAFYQNGAKRMSFDSFVLYKSNGEMVALKEQNVIGNNGKNFAGMLDGENGTYCNAAWGASAATDDWFEVTLPNGVDLGGDFSFSFVTENTTMNAKAFLIEWSYEEPEKVIEYAFAIDAPQGETATVTYDNEAVAVGQIFVEDVELFPGHIACSSLSRSEIVVPVVRDGRVVAVLDIDSSQVGTYDEVDREWLERIVALL